MLIAIYHIYGSLNIFKTRFHHLKQHMTSLFLQAHDSSPSTVGSVDMRVRLESSDGCWVTVWLRGGENQCVISFLQAVWPSIMSQLKKPSHHCSYNERSVSGLCGQTHSCFLISQKQLYSRKLWKGKVYLFVCSFMFGYLKKSNLKETSQFSRCFQWAHTPVVEETIMPEGNL